MIFSKLLALMALLLAAYTVASPEIEDLFSFEERLAKRSCKAVAKSGTKLHRRMFEMDQAAELDVEIEERDPEFMELEARASKYCPKKGGLAGTPKPSHTMHGFTLRQCANYCVCTLGPSQCATFGFKGGVCKTYKQHASSLKYTKSGGTSFYARSCFRKSTSSPPTSSSAAAVSVPTARVKRGDSFDDVVAGALGA